MSKPQVTPCFAGQQLKQNLIGVIQLANLRMSSVVRLRSSDNPRFGRVSGTRSFDLAHITSDESAALLDVKILAKHGDGGAKLLLWVTSIIL